MIGLAVGRKTTAAGAGKDSGLFPSLPAPTATPSLASPRVVHCLAVELRPVWRRGGACIDTLLGSGNWVRL